MKPASLSRRFAAISYDILLVFALMFLGTLPFVAARGGEPVSPGNVPYQLTMLLIAYLFFTGYWCRHGRTLGMQSWRLMVETPNGKRPGIKAATLRFFAAIVSWLPLGLGFWWALWDKDRLAWHDRWSGTRLRYYPKTDN